jgi:hypothetical protein
MCHNSKTTRVLVVEAPNSMKTTLPPCPADIDAVERRSALSTLALAFALVVDAVDDAEASLQRAADRALSALDDALGLAAGRPSHALWGIACRAVATFVSQAELRPLSAGTADALHNLRVFLAENADVVMPASSSSAGP